MVQMPDPRYSRNRNGDRVWVGSTGKYYCGRRVLNCRCCDGHCGPTNGCNCPDCMQLDVSSSRLPPGHLVNREGRVSTLAFNGHFYCGKFLETTMPNQLPPGRCASPHYRCSPERPEWGQCRACAALDGTRYASVHAGDYWA